MSKLYADREAEPPIDEVALMKRWRRLLYKRFRLRPTGEWFTATSLTAFRTKAWSEAYTGPNNERLEWLGDAVCAFYAALFILETVPEERRVKVLENYLARLTTGNFHREIATQLHLEKLVLIPANYIPKVRANRLETREVLLGNLFEALVGAVFLQEHAAAKKMLDRLFRMAFRRLAREGRPFGNAETAGFSPMSPSEWLGYYTLRLLVTAQLCESAAPLYEAHLARERCLRAGEIAKLAETLDLRDDEDDDARAARRILEAIGVGQAFGTSLTPETAVNISNEVFDQFCRAKWPSAPMIESPPDARQNVTDPFADLKTVLNGKASQLLLRIYREAGGATRIELAFKGVVLGIGTHQDPEEAKKMAAHDALKSTLRAQQLANARAGKY